MSMTVYVTIVTNIRLYNYGNIANFTKIIISAKKVANSKPYVAKVDLKRNIPSSFTKNRYEILVFSYLI